MRAYFLFIIFFSTEYLFKTILHYNSLSLPFEFFLIILVTVICIFFYKPLRQQKNSIKGYLTFISLSLIGYAFAYTVLFFQWYWLIYPEYRNVPGDMAEGRSWSELFFCIGSLLIVITSLVTTITIRRNLRFEEMERDTDEAFYKMKNK